MKNIKTLLIMFLGFLGISAMGSDTLYVRFNNFYVKSGTPNDTLLFDAEFKSFTAGTYLAAFQLDVIFNNVAFGASALPVSSTSLELVTSALNISVGPVSTTDSSFRVGKLQLLGPYDPAQLAEVPSTEYAGVMRFKMLVLDGSELAGMHFNVTAMAGNQKFVMEYTSNLSTYSPIVATNDLDDFPLTPTEFNLIFSEIASPSNSSATFVEIYNPSASGFSFDDFTWFVTREDDGGGTYESVQLTGTIGPQSTFVIAGDETDFTTAYPGRVADQYDPAISGAGTDAYFLTMDGEYGVGTDVDIYGVDNQSGSGEPWDYTDSHAVRHYDVTTPNTTYDSTEWVVSPAEDMDMTPGSHHATLTWSGASTSDWRDQDNWEEGYIPDAGHNVMVPNEGETIPVISNGDNAYCEDLTIGGSTSGLMIASDEVDGDGSLITYGTVTGMASVQRFLGADRYWYVTQPVTSAVAGVFLHTWLFTWNEPADDWDPFIEPEDTPLNLMQGYAVWTSSINPWDTVAPPVGDTTVAYEGVLNTGDQSKSLTYTVEGWNFVGNPYPSAVNWLNDGWTKTGLATNAYSAWDGSTYGTYTTGSGGTNGTTQFIPAAQGFFVQTSSAGTLGMTNMVRAHDAQAFWKSRENMMNRLSLTISDGEVNDETVIYFNQNATDGMDYNYDAAKLIAPAAPQAFTMLGNEKMAINTYNNPGQTSSVEMGINAPKSGDYTITATNIESFDESVPIYLEDLETHQFIDLRETSSYSFSSEEGISERFIVHFSNPQGIDDPANSEVNSVYAYNRNVYVNFNGQLGEISIYNILGQEVLRTTASNGLNIFTLPHGNAVYIVKVVSENVNVTKKVFVK